MNENEWYYKLSAIFNENCGDLTTREAQKALDVLCGNLPASEYAVWLTVFSRALRDYYIQREYVGGTE